jgi:hypothetical protein
MTARRAERVVSGQLVPLRSRASIAVGVDGVLLVVVSLVTRDSLDRLDWLDAIGVLAVALALAGAVMRSSRSPRPSRAAVPVRVSHAVLVRDAGVRVLPGVMAGLVAVRASTAVLVAGVFLLSDALILGWARRTERRDGVQLVVPDGFAWVPVQRGTCTRN